MPRSPRPINSRARVFSCGSRGSAERAAPNKAITLGAGRTLNDPSSHCFQRISSLFQARRNSIGTVVCPLLVMQVLTID